MRCSAVIYGCPHTFSHVMHDDKSLNCPVCYLVSVLPERHGAAAALLGLMMAYFSLHWSLSVSCWSPQRMVPSLQSPIDTLRSLFTSYCSRSLEKNGEGKSFPSYFFDFLFHPFFDFLNKWNYLLCLTLAEAEGDPDLLKTSFDTYSTAVITVCHHLLCLFIKGRMDKIEVCANSAAACHDRKQ